MRTLYLILIIVMLFSVTGCYAEITGTVVDAETGQPIEGAVVLVEWTKTKGFPGMTATESFKIVEAVTDKNGNFTVESIKKIFVDPPDLTIYKKGYVAWNNLIIFPDYRKREDFKWQSGHVFKMERFKGYSFIEHQSFIYSVSHAGLAPERKQLFLKFYNEGEREEVIKERKRNY